MAVKVIDSHPSAQAGKCISFHNFAAEEQVTSTETGSAPANAKARKGMYPASVLAKAPNENPTTLHEIAQQMQAQFNALPAEQKQAVLDKVKSAAIAVGTAAAHLQKTTGKNFFDNESIFMLYEAFAVDQMNQNNNITNGWVAQQQAQNVTLQDAANGENEVAQKQTTGRHSSIGAIIGFAALAIVGCALAATGIGAAAGVTLITAAGTMSAGAIALAASGAAIGTGVTLGFAIPASQNPTAKGLRTITAEGPDSSALTSLQTLNTFWSMISQKANQNVQTGNQLDVVNASSNNTQLGQQAAQALQELGQVMQTPINH